MTAPIAGVMETLNAGQTATGSGTVFQARPLNRAFQAWMAGNGAISATVLIEASNDGQNFGTRTTLNLTGNNYASQVFNDTLAPFPFVRATVTAISGNSAAVTVTMGGSNP